MTTLGMLGPAVFYLPFTDACLLAVFGAMVGILPVAYIATFGPLSGNRTMILTRYVTGWYPSKLIVVLTIIIFLGYSLIDGVIGGQILSAVSSNGSLSVIVGIVIVQIINWVVSTFGYGVFHLYERYAWFPQLVVMCILAVLIQNHTIRENKQMDLNDPSLSYLPLDKAMRAYRRRNAHKHRLPDARVTTQLHRSQP